LSLRVTQDVTRDLLASLAALRREENEALIEVASGRRLNAPSDDPAAVASLTGNHSELSQVEQILRNLASVRGTLQVADSTLNSAVLALTRAISLGVQGANGTLSPENRQALAQEVRGLRDQLLTLANVTFQGTYVFAGTAVTTTPFVADLASPSGVAYQGNDGVASIEVGEGQSLPFNLPGNRLFSDPTADVFLAMEHLIEALETSTGMEAATGGVQAAFAHLNTQRAFYGTMLNRLDMAEVFVGRAKFELQRQENTLAAADMESAASRLVQAANAREVALGAAARVSQLSLLDFLR
jgi:flagellar hook-associated protein 3 FlgL